MSMIPEVKCRRCGESFSSMRSTCPNCGTRRVSQSGRTPGATPGTVKGTASYDRAETNTKWQMIFGLILVVAVILAVIVMVSTSLNGAANGSSKITAPIVSENLTPLIETPAPPSPTPTPSVERIDIKYSVNTLDLDKNAPTMRVGDAPLPLTASVYPLSIEGAKVTWSSDDETVLKVTPTEDGVGCTVEILGAKGGGVIITAECFGVKGQCRIYCVEP